MYRKKNREELKNNIFIKLLTELSKIENRVDHLVRQRISSRSSFYFEKFEIRNDGSNWLTLNCVYAEKGWDMDNQVVLENEVEYTKFDIDYDPEFEDFEDLVPKLMMALEYELYRIEK